MGGVKMSNYLANTNTKEIHKLSNVKTACQIDIMKEENKKYLDFEFEVDLLIKNEGFNGCAHCYSEKHTD
jgi:hypothetical protein